jgi:hypothetical protein
VVEFHCCDETRCCGKAFLNGFFDFLDLDFAEAFDFQESFAGGAVNGLDEWLDGMGLDCAWG